MPAQSPIILHIKILFDILYTYIDIVVHINIFTVTLSWTVVNLPL